MFYAQWGLVSSQISLQEIDKKYGLKQWSFLANSDNSHK